ncbi:WD40 repeat domain-containing protein [Streptomyces sp. T028]|uniref:WD40 repeat domain-containing protein n=1 Tax=Streptomyces sp. T028 TaxID=3394379 RepID=UPI003A83A6DB
MPERTVPSPRFAPVQGSLFQPERDAFTDPGPGSAPERDVSGDPGPGPGSGRDVTAARFLLADGRTLLSAVGGMWRTWDVTGHRPLAQGSLPVGSSVVEAVDTRTLVVSVGDHQRLWNTVTGRWTGGADSLPFTTSVALTRDARAYLAQDGDQVRLRAVADGRTLFETTADPSAAAEASTDGRLVAVCSSGGSPRLWDTAGGRVLPGGWQRVRDACAGAPSRF